MSPDDIEIDNRWISGRQTQKETTRIENLILIAFFPFIVCLLPSCSFHSPFFLFIYLTTFFCSSSFFFCSQIVRPINAFLVVDVQNDFISGSLNISNCAAQQNGIEVSGKDGTNDWRGKCADMKESFRSEMMNWNWNDSIACTFFFSMFIFNINSNSLHNGISIQFQSFHSINWKK
jgi:hypothetical protein